MEDNTNKDTLDNTAASDTATTANDVTKPEIINEIKPPEQTGPLPLMGTATPVSVGKKPSVPTKLLAIIVSALVLIIGGSAAAYVGFIKPNQPKNVVKKALSNAMVLNQARSFDITAEINSKDSGTELEFNELKISGGMDNKSNVRADIDIDSGAFNIKAATIVRVDDQKMYVKLSNLDSMFASIPDAMDSPEVANFVNTLSDNWIRFSVEDIQDAGMINDSQAEKASACLTEVSSYIKNSGNDLQKQFDTLYEKSDFAIMTKVGSETVNGTKMTKYSVEINKTKFKAFMKTLGQQLQGSTKKIADKCGIEDAIEEDSDSNDSSNVDVKSIYVWVGPNNQLGKASIALEDDEMSIDLTAVLTNDKVDTDNPDDYLTISELMSDESLGNMLGGMLSGLGE